eukprot:EG_transcript_29944
MPARRSKSASSSSSSRSSSESSSVAGSSSSATRSSRSRSRSRSPPPKTIHVGNLTPNVTKDHLLEIFGEYGKIKKVDRPSNKGMEGHSLKEFAYIEFARGEDADNAVAHMSSGWIDGKMITCEPVLKPEAKPDAADTRGSEKVKPEKDRDRDREQVEREHRRDRERLRARDAHDRDRDRDHDRDRERDRKKGELVRVNDRRRRDEREPDRGRDR